jgi:Tfp pilus assembly protein PilX
MAAVRIDIGRQARQGGVILVISMIILAVLTVIGVSVLSTTGLEEQMTTGFQEQNRAFQVAETGIAQTLNGLISQSDFSQFNPDRIGSGSTSVGSYGATAQLSVNYLGETAVLRSADAASPGRRSAGWGASVSSCIGYHHFHLNSVGSGNNNARADINRGIRVISVGSDNVTCPGVP